MKRCSCKTHQGPNPLPLSQFHKSRNEEDGLARRCKACAKAGNRLHYLANSETVLKRNRDWDEANPDKVRDHGQRYRQAHRKERAAGQRRRYQAARDVVLGHYGRSCACCGSTERLTIDHVNGGGTEHRTELFGRNAESFKMYRWLIRQGFPDGFQVLCLPCNNSKQDAPACRLDHAA